MLHAHMSKQHGICSDSSNPNRLFALISGRLNSADPRANSNHATNVYHQRVPCFLATNYQTLAGLLRNEEAVLRELWYSLVLITVFLGCKEPSWKQKLV